MLSVPSDVATVGITLRNDSASYGNSSKTRIHNSSCHQTEINIVVSIFELCKKCIILLTSLKNLPFCARCCKYGLTQHFLCLFFFFFAINIPNNATDTPTKHRNSVWEFILIATLLGNSLLLLLIWTVFHAWIKKTN